MAAIHAATSEARASHGLPPLARDRALDTIAQAHAEDMAARVYYEHESPEGLDQMDRMERAGYLDACYKDYGDYTEAATGENIDLLHEWQWDHRPAGDVMTARWMDSPGHRENILEPRYDRMGVGVAKAWDNGRVLYGVQNFC